MIGIEMWLFISAAIDDEAVSTSLVRRMRSRQQMELPCERIASRLQPQLSSSDCSMLSSIVISVRPMVVLHSFQSVFDRDDGQFNTK